MDKRKSFINVSTSVFSKLILLVAALYIRRLLIRFIGNTANGLNSLYSSIIGVLSVAELGVGSAIVFSMYAPIVAEDKKRVAALYCLYKKLYRIIGAIIFLAGMLVMPFLPYLINDYTEVSINVYLTFFLTLFSVVLSYLYSSRASLIEAYKDNYVVTGVLTISKLIRYVFQALVILIWHSYTGFVICLIIETLIVGILLDIAVRRKHKDVIVLNTAIDNETKSEIIRNVKAMMMHKVGAVLVGATDSLIISGFVGVVILGKYSNYNYIAGVLSGIIGLFFTPLTSVVGHLCVKKNTEESEKWFNHFYFLNYILGVIIFLGYYAVIDDLIRIIFASDLQMSRTISFIITLNQFTIYMRNSCHLFRNASGTFYNDRWKPVVEGFVNLILSLLFVIILPEEYKVIGVITSTIITTLTICDTVEPYVIFKHVFHSSPKIYYLRNYIYTCLFIIDLYFMNLLMRSYNSPIKGLMVNGMISLLLSTGLFIIIAVADVTFRDEIKTIGKRIISYF